MQPRPIPTAVYHVSWAREYGIASLYFWGCNLHCRICLLQKEVLDCHLPETRYRIYDPAYKNPKPERFLTLSELFEKLNPLEIQRVFLMGAEPVCDRSLPVILDYLRQTKACTISLLTNGKRKLPVDKVDEVIFSIKAVTRSLHRDYTGFDNRGILRNFRELAELPKPRLFAETVFIPGYVDGEEVMRIAAFIASVNRDIPLRIDAYLPMPGQPWRAPTVEEIEALREKVLPILPNTSCLHGKEGKESLAYEVERIF
jgi:pyruvate formate lyase activating enzyme